MKNDKPTTIADGTVEGLLSAIAKPKPAKGDDQGQGARDFDMSIPDEMQGQQERRPMPGQDYYIRPDESLRLQPVVEHGEGRLPPQAPAGAGELEPRV